MPDRRQCLIASLAALGAGSGRSAVAAPVLRYMESAGADLFNSYAATLLGQALQRAGLPHRLEAEPFSPMSQGRMELELNRSDSRLDVMWAMTSRTREQQLLPLRIPLDRGLLGWRVALIRKDDLPRWQKPLDRAELARRRAGQGLHWPDVDILRANGFRVDTVVDGPGIFEMLSAGRIDYFPRSVLEALDELQSFAARDLMVAPNFVLRYPTASYAFLGRPHADLVAPLTRALDALAQDGSLPRLFRQHFQPHLDKLGIAERRIIALDNPLLPPGTPLHRPELWWQPGPVRRPAIGG